MYYYVKRTPPPPGITSMQLVSVIEVEFSACQPHPLLPEN